MTKGKVRSAKWQRLMRYLGSAGLMLVVPTAGLVFWQLVLSAEPSPAIPGPIQVVQATWRWMFGQPKSSLDVFTGTWGEQVLGSAQRVAVGFAVAAVSGVIVGLAIGASRTFRYLLDHIIQAMRTIPVPAWVPFSLIFFGLSPLAAIWLIWLVAFFPVVINTEGAVDRVPANLVNAAKMLGASRTYLWSRVLLPAALPYIFVGLRLGIGMAWIAVVVSELVGVKSGLGYTLFQAYQMNRFDIMIGTMITLAVLGLLSDRIMYALSTRWSYDS